MQNGSSTTPKVLNWLIALAGALLIISPFVLRFSTISLAVYDAILSGIVLLVLGVWGAMTNDYHTGRVLDIINAIVGGLLILAPFLLLFATVSTFAVGTDVVLGLIVVILGVWAAIAMNNALKTYGRTYGTFGQGNQMGTPAYGRGYGNTLTYAGEQPGTTVVEAWNVPGPFTGTGPQGFTRSDERIKEDIFDRLTRHGQLDAEFINVDVHNGDVTLSGTVRNHQDRVLAEDVVDSVSGVKNLHNDLHVRSKSSRSQEPVVGAFDLRDQIFTGEDVIGSEGNSVGKVKQVLENGFILKRRLARDLIIPFDAVQSTQQNQVTLSVKADQVKKQGYETA